MLQFIASRSATLVLPELEPRGMGSLRDSAVMCPACARGSHDEHVRDGKPPVYARCSCTGDCASPQKATVFDIIPTFEREKERSRRLRSDDPQRPEGIGDKTGMTFHKYSVRTKGVTKKDACDSCGASREECFALQDSRNQATGCCSACWGRDAHSGNSK